LAKDKPRNIACLETLWHGDIDRPYTVRGILQTASDLGRFRFAHLTCNTAHELEHNLHILRRRRSYAVLYLAFHGSPGRIALDADELSLEQLADAMGIGFKGRVVHFGTCGTIKVSAERIAAFLERTGVAMVIGYQGNIDG
jgi:hypothetical protein